jgi:hypothetical protein
MPITIAKTACVVALSFCVVQRDMSWSRDFKGSIDTVGGRTFQKLAEIFFVGAFIVPNPRSCGLSQASRGGTT